MGLDTSHGCWSGAYSAFNRWREMIARVAGLPPLELMEGFFCSLNDTRNLPSLWHGSEKSDRIHRLDADLPIKWDCLKPSPLHELLHHSDCDGEIPWESCDPIADCLEEFLPKLPEGEGGGHIGNWRDKTQTFIDGLRLAAKRKESVKFQ